MLQYSSRRRISTTVIGVVVFFIVILYIRAVHYWKSASNNSWSNVNTQSQDKLDSDVSKSSFSIRSDISASNLIENEKKPVIGQVARRIHQTWKTHTLPPRFQLYSASWKRCYPDWEYKLWDDTENREFIRTNFSWFLNTYDSFPQNIYRADAIRYFMMYVYGGIYADLDADCLHPFEHLLTNYSLVFGSMEGQYVVSIDGVYIQNSFFYSRPGHPFWLEVAKEIMRIKTGPQAEYVTGPIMLTALMSKRRSEYEKDWKIYPPSYFNPFSWIFNSHPMTPHCKTLNRMSLEDHEKCRLYFYNRPNTFVVQYHSQTWGNGQTI